MLLRLRLRLDFGLGQISSEGMVGSKEGRTVNEIEPEFEFFSWALQNRLTCSNLVAESRHRLGRYGRIHTQELT